MANTPSAKKRIRRNARRALINKMRRSRIRTFTRRVEEAIVSGDSEAARAALQQAQPEIMRGVTKGVTHKNTAARKVSRLTKRVNALTEGAATE
jgi:small subunit ribosomal protein S20